MEPGTGTPGSPGGAPFEEEAAAAAAASNSAVASCRGNSELKVSACSDHSKLHPGALIGIAACVSSGLVSAAARLPKFGKESKYVVLKS